MVHCVLLSFAKLARCSVDLAKLQPCKWLRAFALGGAPESPSAILQFSVTTGCSHCFVPTAPLPLPRARRTEPTHATTSCAGIPSERTAGCAMHMVSKAAVVTTWVTACSACLVQCAVQLPKVASRAMLVALPDRTEMSGTSVYSTATVATAARF